MPLFKTIKEIAQYITISNANTNSSLPKMRLAEEEFIIPVLGDQLFQDLQQQVDNSPAQDITDTDLLDKVRMALAFLCYYKELPFLHTTITDAGLRNITTDKVQGAYRYQYEDLKQNLENAGLLGLEKLFEYLMENAGTYVDWAGSTAYKRLNRNLIRTGSEFTGYYYLFQPNRTFFALQPIMQEVEDLYISSTIGGPYFDFLKTLRDPSPDEAIVIEFLKKAIANLTIYKAIAKLSIKIRPEGLTVMLGGPDRSPQGEVSASVQQLEDLRIDTFKDGNSYLDQAKAYLNENASPDVFDDYFASSFYVDPTIAVDDINDTMNGMFSMV